MTSVVAPKYAKGKRPIRHFVPPGARSNRAACGVRVSARLKGTVPLWKIDCKACRVPMWNWAVEKVLTDA